MSSITDIDKFLQAVFGSDYGTRAIVAHSVDPKGMAHFRDVKHLDGTRDCYWSIAAFPEDGNATRTKDRALEVRALVIDDVNTKVSVEAVERALGVPTTKLETSHYNFQWVYRLDKPVPVKDWDAFFSEIERRVGKKLEGRDAVHLFRLPMGRNTKPKRDKFHVHEYDDNYGNKLSVGNYPHFPTGPGPSSSGGDGAVDKLGAEDLRALVMLVPNEDDTSRDVWSDVGHDVKATCKNDDDGWEIFNDWAALWKGVGSSGHGYEEAYTREKWEGFGAGGLKSKGHGLRARAAITNPEGYRKWLHGMASRAFPDDLPPSPGGGGYKVTPERMAEEITSAEAGRLGWLDVAPGRWAAFDPVMGRWVRYAGDAVLWAVVKQEMQRRARMGIDAKVAVVLDSGKFRTTVCRLLNKEIKMILPAGNFDRNTDLVGMPGRVLVLNHGRGLPHIQRPGRPEDFVAKSTSVGPGGKCPHWDKFMREFCMGKVELVRWWQTFLGYCLSGRTEEHTLVFLYGPGGNGKSVLLDVVGEVLGDYHARADHRLFMAKGQGNFHLAPLAALEGARLVTVPDVPTGAVWDMGIVKQVTGGGTVTANKMHQDPTSYTPQFKIILAGNEKPRLENVDDGVRRRMVLVPALNKPAVVDKGLVDKLRGEKEGILAWLIDGWEKYATNGGLPACSVIDKATEEYLTGADVFGNWAATCWDRNAGAGKRVKMADAFRSWDAYRSAEGSFKASPNNVQAMSSKLKEMGWAWGRNNTGAYIDRAELVSATASGAFSDLF